MRADWIRLMIAAARLPLRSDPTNSQFERLYPVSDYDQFSRGSPAPTGRAKARFFLADFHSP
ncbi:hypothetical protein AN403_6171 [Pseudomonas fluorescens]|uniref:Uncharacterized protein n=2 Tax=Pseudomonas fluorescens TaxID=294 RepID=A0A0P8XXF8_PSEFL|nr:hypothetical protein AN403_6171 [Pseudomonas fluorescens]